MLILVVIYLRICDHEYDAANKNKGYRKGHRNSKESLQRTTYIAMKTNLKR